MYPIQWKITIIVANLPNMSVGLADCEADREADWVDTEGISGGSLLVVEAPGFN